jgi:hypothetical protein
MINHKIYHLNVDEEFLISLPSKLITYFIDGFTLGMISQSIAYLPIGSEYIYILDFGPWSWGALNKGFVD